MIDLPFPNTYPRFWDNYELEGECWVWTGRLDNNGYGRYSGIPAHILAFVLSGKILPNGYCIDHKCKVKSCGNPNHLDAVTYQENSRRYYGNSDTHFSCGHSIENNSYKRIQGRKLRLQCRYCSLTSYADKQCQDYPEFEDWLQSQERTDAES